MQEKLNKRILRHLSAVRTTNSMEMMSWLLSLEEFTCRNFAQYNMRCTSCGANIDFHVKELAVALKRIHSLKTFPGLKHTCIPGYCNPEFYTDLEKGFLNVDQIIYGKGTIESIRTAIRKAFGHEVIDSDSPDLQEGSESNAPNKSD